MDGLIDFHLVRGLFFKKSDIKILFCNPILIVINIKIVGEIIRNKTARNLIYFWKTINSLIYKEKRT